MIRLFTGGKHVPFYEYATRITDVIRSVNDLKQWCYYYKILTKNKIHKKNVLMVYDKRNSRLFVHVKLDGISGLWKMNKILLMLVIYTYFCYMFLDISRFSKLTPTLKWSTRKSWGLDQYARYIVVKCNG